MVDAEKDKTKDVEIQEETNKCRMTIRGRDVKALESVCGNIVKRAKDSAFVVKGPVRVPTKKLSITTFSLAKPWLCRVLPTCPATLFSPNIYARRASRTRRPFDPIRD